MGCDFRGANLDGLRLDHTMFDHCRFYDMTGKPDLSGPCTLIAPDFSAAGDGREDMHGTPGLRDPGEVLEVWRERDARRINHWSRYADVTRYQPERFYPERRGKAAPEGEP